MSEHWTFLSECMTMQWCCQNCFTPEKAAMVNKRATRFALNFVVMLLGLMPNASTSAAEPVQFNRDIRPILANHCFQCHGPDSPARKGGLRLDQRDHAIAPAESGSSAIVPNRAEASELVKRILADDAETVMPPPEVEKPLTPLQIDLLQQWIKEGAQYEAHWSFIAPQRRDLPKVQQTDWPRNDIDYFILARLESESLHPAPEAELATLIRRLSLDLTGLPPTPTDVDAFLAEMNAASIAENTSARDSTTITGDTPNAASKTRMDEVFQRWVNRYLDSPHYGERMAVDWLDAARFADTNGYQVDRDREMYAWRDWVIEAFNANMKFDDFTIEQIAGDLLPNATISQKIATGFHRNHMMNEEGGVIAEEFLAEYCADRVETTAAVWLGQTFNCTRCHDHKFDPFTQKDFYGLYAFFHNVSEQGIGNYGANFRRNAPPFLTLPAPELEAKLAMLRTEQTDAQKTLTEIDARLMADYPAWEAGLQKLVTDGATTTPSVTAVPAEIAAILKKETASRSDAEKAMLVSYQQTTHPERKALAERIAGLPKLINDTEMSIPTALVMEELATPRVTHILLRGEYNKLGEVVLANTPASLPAMSADLPRNRLGLAKWLTDPENPLTARVTVNRLWQSLFGVGLVRTSEDFGTQGELPSHPELLDWLATEFIRSDWDVKHMLRLMVSSATYRQSSRVTPDLHERDPANRLLARGPRFRLQSEFLRDQALFASGLLVTKTGGPSVKSYHPPGLYEQVTAGSGTNIYVEGSGPDLYRRSMYSYWKRSVPNPAMLVFDAPFREACTLRRPRTNTPLQSLNLMNDPTYVEAARFLAGRILIESGPDIEAQLSYGFRLVLARAPKAAELRVLVNAYERSKADFAADPAAAAELLKVGATRSPETLDLVELAAMTSVASTILNLDETVMKE
jgi:mono/diheme cytochrome c family protein